MTPTSAAAYLDVPVERVRVNKDSRWVVVKTGETTELAAPLNGIAELKEQMEGRDG